MGKDKITPFSRGNVSALEVRFGVLMNVLHRRPSQGLERKDLAPGPMNLLMVGNLAIE
jgi:hypothetical protein